MDYGVVDIDPLLLRTFIAVSVTGSFTAAAPRVHRSQSAVSMQIRKLEETVGAELFERANKTVRLTARGEVLLGHARRILQQQDAALHALKEMAIEGSVRLGVMDDYATHVLPPILTGFERRYPAVRLEVTTGMTAELIGDLGTAFDLVLATQPAGTGTGTVLRSEPTAWAYSATEPLPMQDEVPLALLKRGNLFRKWATEALDRVGRPWRIVMSSTSISAMEAAAEAGMAITVVKRGTARKGLRLLGENEGLPSLPTSEIALHQALSSASPAISQLASHLQTELQKT